MAKKAKSVTAPLSSKRIAEIRDLVKAIPESAVVMYDAHLRLSFCNEGGLIERELIARCFVATGPIEEQPEGENPKACVFAITPYYPTERGMETAADVMAGLIASRRNTETLIAEIQRLRAELAKYPQMSFPDEQQPVAAVERQETAEREG